MIPSAKWLFLIVAMAQGATASAQETIQIFEPGIGYSRVKKWAIDSNLVFENYTKDTIVIRNTGKDLVPNIYIFAHFCAGDDYAGRANNIVIQENFPNDRAQPGGTAGSIEALQKQRRYIELLAGAPQEGKFKGTFTIRPERKDARGLGIEGESEKGKWEIGIFLYNDYTQLQVSRSKDAICN